MTAEEHRKVVVRFTPELYEYQDRSRFAARIEGLGLTSYGLSPEEAVVGLDSIFRAFIDGHRETGRLEEVLNGSGVEWYWLDQYSGRYRDVSVSEEVAVTNTGGVLVHAA